MLMLAWHQSCLDLVLSACSTSHSSDSICSLVFTGNSSFFWLEAHTCIHTNTQKKPHTKIAARNLSVWFKYNCSPPSKNSLFIINSFKIISWTCLRHHSMLLELGDEQARKDRGSRIKRKTKTEHHWHLHWWPEKTSLNDKICQLLKIHSTIVEALVCSVHPVSPRSVAVPRT